MSFPWPPPQGFITIKGIVATIVPTEESWSVRESQPASGPEVWVMYQCQWSDRFRLVQALSSTVSSLGVVWTRTVPHQYPWSPNLYCMEIGEITWIKGQAIAGNVFPSAELARVPACYRVPPWQFTSGAPGGQIDPSGKPWTTTRIRSSSEIQTVPNGTYFWPGSITINGVAKSGMAVPESALGIPRPRLEITMVRKWAGSVPVNFMATYQGNSNLNPVTIGDYSFPQGSLLLLTMGNTPGSDSAGNQIQDIEYQMVGNGGGIDWNAILAGDGQYHLVNTNPSGGGLVPFPYSDWYPAMP